MCNIVCSAERDKKEPLYDGFSVGSGEREDDDVLDSLLRIEAAKKWEMLLLGEHLGSDLACLFATSAARNTAAKGQYHPSQYSPSTGPNVLPSGESFTLDMQRSSLFFQVL